MSAIIRAEIEYTRIQGQLARIRGIIAVIIQGGFKMSKLTLQADTVSGIYQQRLQDCDDGAEMLSFDDFMAGLRTLKEGQFIACAVDAAGWDELTAFSGYRINEPQYCTQNEGDCLTCSLANYGKDCKNIPLD